MNRRELLKAIPLAALTPKIMAEGVARYDVEPAGHFIFFVDVTKVDIETLCESGNERAPLMPKGSKGGWIIGVHGDVENAVKIFRLNETPVEGTPIIKSFTVMKNG